MMGRSERTRSHRAMTMAQLHHNEGNPMDIFEIKQKETVSREEVAERLRLLADMLSRHNDLEFERGGMQFKVHVPDEVQLKVELEVETDERELEIELKW
jgi:amphi-Trp domain-containing protein